MKQRKYERPALQGKLLRVRQLPLLSLRADGWIPAMAKKKDEPKFEELVASVEAALQQLDSGDLPLEDALKRYEEGVAALRQAFGILKQAEKKVQLLSEREGEIATRDFEVEEEESEGKKLF